MRILRRLARSEWPFAVALLLGAFIRALAELGFRPALWYNDGFEYLGVAARWHAYVIRPNGYSAFLLALVPFHSFALVAAVQHLLGLATAVLLYSLLRRWRVHRTLAAIGMLPLLLDVREVQLEHIVLSDTLFTFLLVVGVVLLAWQQRVSPKFAALAGLALALAALTRTVGVPMLALGALFLIARWSGWRPIMIYTVVVLVPLGSYATWFHHEHGSYALNRADGVFLYSRVMQFADCAAIKPPKSLAVLCDPRPPAQRPPSQNYVWHTSPLDALGPGGESALPEQRFIPARNDAGLSFAIKAVEAQPGAYLRAGGHDFLRSFAWTRTPFPNAAEVAAYQFSNHPVQILPRVFVAGGTAREDTSAYERSAADTRLVQPFAAMVIAYQRFGVVPGPLLAALLVLGFAGLIGARHRDGRRWQLLLLGVVSLALLLVPPFSVEFDYRYAMPAVPFAATAAALALAILVPRWSNAGMTAPRIEPGPEPRARAALTSGAAAHPDRPG